MIRGPSPSTRTDTRLPHTALFRSDADANLAVCRRRRTVAHLAGVLVVEAEIDLADIGTAQRDDVVEQRRAVQVGAPTLEGQFAVKLHGEIGRASCRGRVMKYV